MYYEINVSKMKKEKGWNGKPSYRHYFATASRSINDESKLKAVLKDLLKAFPEPQFEISASYVTTTGRGVDIASLNLDREKLELKQGFYLFGNKGAVHSDGIHICEAGHLSGGTLCGTPTLSSNYVDDDMSAGCVECIKRYKEITK